MVWGYPSPEAGVGTLSEFVLLKPELDHFHMNNKVGASECGGAGNVHDPQCTPMHLGATVEFDFPSHHISDVVNVTLSVGDLR